MKRNRKDFIAGLIFSSPWIIGFLIFTLYPIAISFYYSFTTFSIFQPPKFVGLETVKSLLEDELFSKSLFNTLYMTVLATPINIAFGLGTAILLNMKIKGLSIYRTLFYIPSVVPQVAASILWIWILNARYGLLNNILKVFGVYQPNWFQDPAYTKPALILMALWSTGTIMIIFLAALQDVPVSLYEAADMDGANRWYKFTRIIIPSISPVILYQFIVGIIFNFQIFTQAWIIGEAAGGLNQGVFGGPENSILFYATYLFYNAFTYLKMGTASAMAWILFILTAVVTFIVFKTSNRWVTYGGE